MIRDGIEQGLLGWEAAPQGKAADAMMGEIDLATHQARWPLGAYGKVLPKQMHRAALGGASDEDYLPTQRGLQVEIETLRHRPAQRGRLGGLAATRPVGGDIGVRTRLQLGCATDVVTLPHLGLPQAVEAFDGVLHTVLQRWHEHWNDPQRQTQPADAAHRVGKLVRTLK